MSADPSVVSAAANGGAPTWAQYEALAIPPPLPQADDATIDALERQAPKPPDLAKIGQPSDTERRALDRLSQTELDDLQDLRAGEKAYVQDVRANQAQQERLTQAEIDALSEQPPAPPQQTSNPLQRMAPLLLMAAFGGKLTQLDAGAMLAATTGTVQGYLAGNQQAYENAQKAYADAYERFKDRQEQQLKIFEEMKKAYAGRPDADLKALQAAHDMTGDEIKVSQQLLETQEHIRTAAQQLAENQYKLDKESYDERVKLELARKKDAAVAAQATDNMTDDQLRTLAKTAIVTGRDPGFGMGKSALRNRYQAIKADEIKQMGGAGAVVGAQAGARATMTEATQVARREGNIEASATALTEPGGLYDQLLSAAQKVNLGDSKTANAVRIGIQQHVYANPDIQRYVTILEDTRADLTNVLARTGQATETVRAQAHNMFPDTMSVPELQAAIDASKKVTQAVMAGNQAVMDALKNGYSVEHAATLTGTGPPKATVSAATLKAYADKHGISTDAAKAFLTGQGFQVQ